MPKYLMLDHGGVLDGEISMSKPSKNDLLLEQYEWGGYRLLKNGVQIVNDLCVLVNQHACQLIFHSKNQESDQMKVLNDLRNACHRQGLQLLPIYAMAVRDSSRYPTVPSQQPILILDRPHGVRMAAYDYELDGKACVRQALSVLLGISPKERNQHIVFDDGDSVVFAAKAEGYQAYLIGSGENRVKLVDAISMVRQQLQASQNVPKISQRTIFSEVDTYQGLPLTFRQYLSATTQLLRHSLGHISTEDYWTQVDQAAKNQLRQSWEQTLRQVNSMVNAPLKNPV